MMYVEHVSAPPRTSEDDLMLLRNLRRNLLHAEADHLALELWRDYAEETNSALASLLLSALKQEARASAVILEETGSGGQSYVRRFRIMFKNNAWLDLELQRDRINFGYGYHPTVRDGSVPRSIPYEEDTPKQIYRRLVSVLKPWAQA